MQVFVEGGRGEFGLEPPLEPGESRIVATSGTLKAEARLDFLPELRKLVAAGVLEGIDQHAQHQHARAHAGARLRRLRAGARATSRATGTTASTQAGARAAFFLKGKIKGEYLLTAAYDSDKDTQERLFRDIQPDEFYPVYGDSAVRGFDAQSTSKLYVRVDNEPLVPALRRLHHRRRLARRASSPTTRRSLTGVREHYENSQRVA